MEGIKKYYQQLPQRQKIIMIVSIAIILMVVLHPFARNVIRARQQSPGKYIKQLKSKDKQEKCTAILNIGSYNTKKAVPILENILENDPDPDVKKLAVVSLETLDRERLLSKLNDNNNLVKSAIVDGLLYAEVLNIRYKVPLLMKKNLHNKYKLPSSNSEHKNIPIILDKFSNFDKDTKMRILVYLDTYAKESEFEDRVLTFATNQEELIETRKKSLEILQKIGTRNIVDRLSGITREDSDAELRKLAEDTINIIMERERQNEK